MSKAKKQEPEKKGCDCSLCKKPDWMTKEQHLCEVGKFLGYPKCCIEALVKDNGKWYGDLRFKGAFYKNRWTAYIPCERHAERFVNEGKSPARVIRNRVSTSPFPYANKVQFDKYIKKLKRQHDKRTKAGQEA